MTDNRPRVAIMPNGHIEAWFAPRGDQDDKPVLSTLYVALDRHTGEIVKATVAAHTTDFAVLHAAARAYFDQLKR